jgi:hypothetical protein
MLIPGLRMVIERKAGSSFLFTAPDILVKLEHFVQSRRKRKRGEQLIIQSCIQDKKIVQ